MKTPTSHALSILTLAGFHAQAAQMTDFFDDRPQLAGINETLTADTTFAGIEPGEDPGMHGNRKDQTVWAEWIAPASGTVTVDTFGTSFTSPVLAVYAGDSLASLLTVARAAYDRSRRLAHATFPVTEGQAYQIVLDSASSSRSSSGLGMVNIRLAIGDLPVSFAGTDRFADRPRMSGNRMIGVGNNEAASLDVLQPGTTGRSERDLWWEWTAPATGRVIIDTLQSNFDTVLTVFSGNPEIDPPFSGLEMVAQNDDVPNTRASQVSFQTKAGRTYQIAVSGDTSSPSGAGNVVLNLVHAANANPPAVPGSDSFARRPNLTGSAAAGAACNTYAGTDPSEIVPRGDGERSIWWQWTAPESGWFDLDTMGSQFDTMLRVYTGDDLASLVEVASNDDAPGAEWSGLGLKATRGTVYQICVDSGSTSRSKAGNIVLNLKRRPAPEIDVQQPVRSKLASGRSKRNFGTVRLDSSGRSQVFTLRNTGNAPLTGVLARVSGSHAADFAISRPAATTVAAGAQTTFTVTFRPQSAGSRRAELRVFSNDADENPFRVTLGGKGVR